MKKFLMFLACLFVIVPLSGQVFAGGPHNHHFVNNDVSNDNVNVNKISNDNVNEIDNDATANSGAAANVIDNSTKNVYDRKFVAPGVTPIPQTGSFTTKPTQDSSYRSIRTILDMLVGNDANVVYVTEGSLENWAKKGNVDTHLQLFRDENQVPRAYSKDYKGKKWIGIAIQEYDYDQRVAFPVPGLTVTAMLDGEADNDDTNSLQVIGKVALKALKDGNNYLVITGQGVHRAVASSGWGIGLYATHGTTSEGGKSSTVGGGGTGYASNHAMTEDRPWIQAFAGVKDIPYPREKYSEVKEEKKKSLSLAERKVTSRSGWGPGEN